MYGPDFPGETVRVLENNEIKKYGEYRTRRLVLEAWDRLGLAPRNRDGRYDAGPPADLARSGSGHRDGQDGRAARGSGQGAGSPGRAQ